MLLCVHHVIYYCYRDHHTSDIVGEGEGKERILWSEKYSPKNFTDLLSDDVRLTAQVLCTCNGGLKIHHEPDTLCITCTLYIYM